MSIKNKQDVIDKFLHDSASINDVWNTFELDADAEGYQEDCKSQVHIEEVMYESLNYFCRYKHKIKKRIDPDEAKPYVRQIMKDLGHKMDSTPGGLISKEEFSKVGDYLKNEFRKLNLSMRDETLVEEGHMLGDTPGDTHVDEIQVLNETPGDTLGEEVHTLGEAGHKASEETYKTPTYSEAWAGESQL